MSDPIDIKTKKIIPSKSQNKFQKSLVLESLEHNILSHWDTWGKFQQAWTSRAYKSFKDLDKYVVLIYLIRDNWVTLSGKFQYQSMDEFYETEGVTIEKINLIQISNDLNIINAIKYNEMFCGSIKRAIDIPAISSITTSDGSELFVSLIIL